MNASCYIRMLQCWLKHAGASVLVQTVSRHDLVPMLVQGASSSAMTTFPELDGASAPFADAASVWERRSGASRTGAQHAHGVVLAQRARRLLTAA